MDAVEAVDVFVPMCVFETSVEEWVLWRPMDVAGPACLACRPKV